MGTAPILRPACALLATLLATAACHAAAPDDRARQPTSQLAIGKRKTMPNQQQVQQAIGVTFPDGATVQHAAMTQGRDNAASAVLLLSQADWQKWRDTLIPPGSDVPPFSPDANDFLGPDEGS